MNLPLQHSVGELPLAATNSEAIDRVNAAFYDRFPYPWRAHVLEQPVDADFTRKILNQDVGCWRHDRVPRKPSIWVAGCGTNQAVITALNFPDSAVVGSDLSDSSLATAEDTAKALGIENLELRRESLNEVNYRERFDYIVCTGVIHHNANPETCLRRLATALKPSGVLELMVYNRFHRTVPAAFQKAVRLLCTSQNGRSVQDELGIAHSLLDSSSGEGLVAQALKALKTAENAEIADTLLQPVEWSYTVDTLASLVGCAGLEILTPRVSVADKAVGRISWNYRFANPDIQTQYDSFPDLRRWEISNLLWLERSPRLWFYCGRKDSTIGRKGEWEISKEFLALRCSISCTQTARFLLGENQRYRKLGNLFPYPARPSDPESKRILDAVEQGLCMRQVLEKAGVPMDELSVNELRVRLSTSAFPHLISQDE